MNAAASSKAKPLSLLCSPEKYSPSCFLNAVLYKLLKHALRYIASWTILSPFLSFVSSKEFSYKFAHLHILWSSLKDCDRYNDSQWLMFRYKKNVRSTSLEDFDVWRETAKKTEKSWKSIFRILLLTKSKFSNFKKFPRTYSKMADTAIL